MPGRGPARGKPGVQDPRLPVRIDDRVEECVSRDPRDRRPTADPAVTLAGLRGRAEAQQEASPSERRRRQARERARQTRKPLPWPVVVTLVFYRFCFILLGTAITSAVTIALFFVGAWRYLERSMPPEVIVPHLVGKADAEARTYLESVGLTAAVESVPNREVPAGQVAGMNPKPGRRVSAGRMVTLQVSTGPELVMVPRLVGETFAAAQDQLGKLGLKIGATGRKPDPRLPAGTILSQNPGAGRRVDVGTKVDLYVSAGPPEGESEPARRVGRSDPVVDAPAPGREQRVGTVLIPVPSKPDLSTIRIVLRDENGEQTVFDEICHAGDLVRQTVRGVGRSTVEVYINDRKVKEQDL